MGVAIAAAAVARSAAATAWSIQRAPAPPDSDSWLSGVSCTSARDCTAVGWSAEQLAAEPVPLVEHWNGTTWSMQRTPIPTTDWGGAFLAVSCTSGRACVAVGASYAGNSSGPLAERWDGSSWSIQHVPRVFGPDQFNGVSCVASTDCVAVGYGQAVARWDGHRWRAQNVHVTGPRDLVSIGLTSVSCPSHIACAAVGKFDIVCDYYDYYSVPILGFWTFGRSWLRPNPDLDCSNSRGGGGSRVLNAVSCTSTAACTAVGTAIYRWNGRRWFTQPARLGTDDELNGVSCTSANACTAVGPDIYTWNGRASSRVTVPRPSEAAVAWLAGVSCTSRDSCIAVGDYQNQVSQDSLLIEATGR
ncbi:MAG TPA: hypothetical protein VJ741_08960 [Solirubrobacteraceae bacterium]|nr:hypothetical protein [Solirubrobacteraceae bacterium]